MLPHHGSSIAELCDQDKSPFEFTRAIEASSVTTGFCSQLKRTLIHLIIEKKYELMEGGQRNLFKSTPDGSERVFYISILL